MLVCKSLTAMGTIVSAAFAVSAQSDMSAAGTKSSGKKGTTDLVDPTVALLQSLQQAQISSMSCLISLVNMTSQPVGDCLGIQELTTILFPVQSNAGSVNTAHARSQSKTTARPVRRAAEGDSAPTDSDIAQSSGNGTATDFAGSFGNYLASVCKSNECLANDLVGARAELASKCGSQMKGGLVPMLDAMMANYATSYRTMACSVH